MLVKVTLPYFSVSTCFQEQVEKVKKKPFQEKIGMFCMEKF